MELVRKEHIDSSNGQTYSNYYLVLENGNRIAIKPSFNKDYSKLRLLARKVDE